MAESKGRRSLSKIAVSREMAWSAWAQKYAAKASGKLHIFAVAQCMQCSCGNDFCHCNVDCLQIWSFASEDGKLLYLRSESHN